LSEIKNSIYAFYQKSYEEGDYEEISAATTAIVSHGTTGSGSGNVLTDTNATFMSDGVRPQYFDTSVPGSVAVHHCHIVGQTTRYSVTRPLSETQVRLSPNPPAAPGLEYYIGPALNTDCVESYRRHGTEETLEFKTEFIRDDTTGDNLRDHLVDYFKDRQYIATVRTHPRSLRPRTRRLRVDRPPFAADGSGEDGLDGRLERSHRHDGDGMGRD